jgi:hypothetical protein
MLILCILMSISQTDRQTYQKYSSEPRKNKKKVLLLTN